MNRSQVKAGLIRPYLRAGCLLIFLVLLLRPSDGLAQIKPNEIEGVGGLSHAGIVERQRQSETVPARQACNPGSSWPKNISFTAPIAIALFESPRTICGSVEEKPVKDLPELTIKACTGEIYGVSDPKLIKKFQRHGLPGNFIINLPDTGLGGGPSWQSLTYIAGHDKPFLVAIESVQKVTICPDCPGAPVVVTDPPPVDTAPPPIPTEPPLVYTEPPVVYTGPPPVPTEPLPAPTEPLVYTEPPPIPTEPPEVTDSPSSPVPQVRLIVSGEETSLGVYQSPVNVQIEVADGSSKSDVSRIEYALNTDNQAQEYSGPFTLNVNQPVILYAYAIDLAGNRSNPAAQVRIENSSAKGIVRNRPTGGSGIGLIILLMVVAGSATYLVSVKRRRGLIGAGSSQANLLFLNGPLAGRQLPVSGIDVSIGRGSTNALRFTAPGVSRQHAKIKFDQGRWYLSDLSSTGTFVNDRRVDYTEIRNGDQIRMGNIALQFQTASPGATSTGKLPPVSAQAKLTVRQDRRANQTILLSGQPLVIGRGAASQLRLNDSDVSRVHARITFGQGGWRIQDLNSTYGTKVNGSRIQAVALNSGDVIQIGSIEIIFSA